MTNSRSSLQALSSSDLLTRTRELVHESSDIEGELLVHLAEIDERKLYLECAFPSMFAFCVGELGFSDEVAYNRITVARATRRFPSIIHAVRSGELHLTGVRLLVPHLTAENHRDVLAKAAGKSKREIEELVARISPQPPVPTLIRKLPEPAGAPSAVPPPPVASEPGAALAWAAQPAPSSRRDEHRPVFAPLSEDTFKIQFTARRALRDKLRQAQDLFRHRVPDGDLATIIEKAVDLLIEDVKRERFATGRKARPDSSQDGEKPPSRHIPDAIKRAVFERDGGRCTFADERARRCAETAGLEFDHVDGFARTHTHQLDRIRLLCRAHTSTLPNRSTGAHSWNESARETRPELVRGIPGPS